MTVQVGAAHGRPKGTNVHVRGFHKRLCGSGKVAQKCVCDARLGVSHGNGKVDAAWKLEHVEIPATLLQKNKNKKKMSQWRRQAEETGEGRRKHGGQTLQSGFCRRWMWKTSEVQATTMASGSHIRRSPLISEMPAWKNRNDKPAHTLHRVWLAWLTTCDVARSLDDELGVLDVSVDPVRCQGCPCHLQT